MICNDKSEIDVAIKAPLAFFRTEIINSVYEEIRRQTKFSHENVVKCLGFYHNKTQKYPVLILEWMFYGSLAKVFERSKLQKALNCYTFQGRHDWQGPQGIGLAWILPNRKRRHHAAARR